MCFGHDILIRNSVLGVGYPLGRVDHSAVDYVTNRASLIYSLSRSDLLTGHVA